MAASFRYETPENIELQYHAAGLGTRFVAWFIDSLILNVSLFVAFIMLTVVAASVTALRDVVESIFETLGAEARESPEKVGMYFIGIAMVIWGLGSFLYYGLSEFLMRGQTIGKRICKIRVVKDEGFSLDAVSIAVRNLFRVIDQFPVLWIVPVLSGRSQRLGDLAAGTLVVADQPHKLPSARVRLSGRSAADARYRFDYAKLQRLRPSDFDAIERCLEQWDSLSADQRQGLGDRMLPALCKRMAIEEPAQADRHAFLEDLMAAEYRRQERTLA
jgi:uncharacterized RDD family membrane protein YckC